MFYVVAEIGSTPTPPPPSQSANTAILVTYIFALSIFFLFSVCKHDVGAGKGGKQIPIAAKNLVLWAYFVPGALQFQDLVSAIPGGGSALGLVSKVLSTGKTT